MFSAELNFSEPAFAPTLRFRRTLNSPAKLHQLMRQTSGRTILPLWPSAAKEAYTQTHRLILKSSTYNCLLIHQTLFEIALLLSGGLFNPRRADSAHHLIHCCTCAARTAVCAAS